MRYFYLLILVFSSCTVPDKASLGVMRETRKLQKSPIILNAGNHREVTDDKIVLRQNNSFTYRSHTRGTQKVVIYAGVFAQNGDTLVLNFHNGHKDESWSGIAIIDRSANIISLLSKDTSQNKLLVITATK